MSGNRRKKTASPTPPPQHAQEPAPARVVAIPKETPAEPQPETRRPGAAKPHPRSERIGDALRQARLDRGEDLYAIAEYLCIKPNFLIALENSHYDQFPADTYIIGFLRTYADFLGVKDAGERYRYEMAGRRKEPVLTMPTPLTEGRAPSGLIMVGALVAALFVYAIWYGLSASNRRASNAPPPLPTAQQIVPAPSVAASGAAAGLTAPVSASVSTPAPAATASAAPMQSAAQAASPLPPAAGIEVTGRQPDAHVAAADKDIKETKEAKTAAEPKAAETAETKDAKPAAKPAAPKPPKTKIYGSADNASGLVIHATQSSWVLITDPDGTAVFDHVLKPGDSYRVPDRPGLRLTTGNGSGITLTRAGQTLPKISSGAPHVVRDIPLGPDMMSGDQ
ncbi:MAG: DUF4115 domain-containing protein [Alphaproteobacteria bacterium]|nr:DUF4115 domain-containing protein [Alphaproteobacteria bacterium]